MMSKCMHVINNVLVNEFEQEYFSHRVRAVVKPKSMLSKILKAQNYKLFGSNMIIKQL